MKAERRHNRRYKRSILVNAGSMSFWMLKEREDSKTVEQTLKRQPMSRCRKKLKSGFLCVVINSSPNIYCSIITTFIFCNLGIGKKQQGSQSQLNMAIKRRNIFEFKLSYTNHDFCDHRNSPSQSINLL